MATGPEIINRQFSSNRLMLRGLIGFDSDGNPVIVRSDADGVVKVQIEGIYNGTTRTPIAVDIDGKLESSATVTAYVDNLESLTQSLIDLSKYAFRNVDSSSDPIYVGYEADDDEWRIMKFTKATGVALYATGTSGYAAAWVLRADQSYS